MKLRLEFMAVVSSDGMNPEGQFLNNMIDKIDSAFLGMGPIDLEHTNPGGIIDGGVLVPSDLFGCR